MFFVNVKTMYNNFIVFYVQKTIIIIIVINFIIIIVVTNYALVYKTLTFTVFASEWW